VTFNKLRKNQTGTMPFLRISFYLLVCTSATLSTNVLEWAFESPGSSRLNNISRIPSEDRETGCIEGVAESWRISSNPLLRNDLISAPLICRNGRGVPLLLLDTTMVFFLPKCCSSQLACWWQEAWLFSSQ
jgi:hypothetical protein